MSLKLLRQSLALDEKCASNNESNQKKLSGRQRRKRAKQAQRARFINKINSISKFVPLQGFSTVEQCRNEETPHIAKLNERYLKFTERTRVDTNVGENLMRRMMEQMNADQKKLARRKDIGNTLGFKRKQKPKTSASVFTDEDFAAVATDSRASKLGSQMTRIR